MEQSNLAVRIVDLREKQEMTQTELAKKMGLDKSSMSKIENGTRKVSSDELRKLSDIFDVSADYLLGTVSKKSNNDLSLDEAVDSVMSFDGRPVTDHDRQMMKSLWKSYLENKD
ncbi:MAG TPA: helix-turn-helix domain-containing protein [Candidatus Limosilactobacillus intestinipullorum]|nr:helix-turn-helix domain-containing protein [Candidatus Limosilactobacillus intestinipullorum]